MRRGPVERPCCAVPAAVGAALADHAPSRPPLRPLTISVFTPSLMPIVDRALLVASSSIDHGDVAACRPCGSTASTGTSQHVVLLGAATISTLAVISGLSRRFCLAGDLDLDLEGHDVGDVHARVAIRTTLPWNLAGVGVGGDRRPPGPTFTLPMSLSSTDGQHEDARQVRERQDRRPAADVADARGDDLADLHVARGDHAVHRRSHLGVVQAVLGHRRARSVSVSTAASASFTSWRFSSSAMLLGLQLILLDAGIVQVGAGLDGGRLGGVVFFLAGELLARGVASCGRPWRGRPWRWPRPTAGRPPARFSLGRPASARQSPGSAWPTTSLACEACSATSAWFSDALLVDRVQLHQQVALLDRVADVERQLDDLAAGLALDVHVEVGDDAAVGGHGEPQRPAFHLRRGDRRNLRFLRGLLLAPVVVSRRRAPRGQQSAALSSFAWFSPSLSSEPQAGRRETRQRAYRWRERCPARPAWRWRWPSGRRRTGAQATRRGAPAQPCAPPATPSCPRP